MGKLLCRDGMLRLAANVRERPEQWLSRLIFLLGPWVSFWMVEILNGNDVFSDLYSWQVLMNLIWYYLLFLLCRLILGRRRRAAATAAGLSFFVGIVNHYVLRFRGRILFPADLTAWETAANVADAFDFSLDAAIRQGAVLLVAYLFLVWMCVPQRKRDQASPVAGRSAGPGRGGVLLRLFQDGGPARPGDLHPAVGDSGQRLSVELHGGPAVQFPGQAGGLQPRSGAGADGVVSHGSGGPGGAAHEHHCGDERVLCRPDHFRGAGGIGGPHALPALHERKYSPWLDVLPQ